MPEIKLISLPCDHPEFAAQVNVNRIAEGEAWARSFMADITIKCASCGTPFRFLGAQTGVSFRAPSVSVDETELRAPIMPAKGWW